MKNLDQKKPTCLDLFCGCGGFSLGFERAGYDVRLGIDVWNDALVTYQHNHKQSAVMCDDLSKIEPKDVAKQLGDKQIDVIIGGPPCQGFSIAGKHIVEDKRNELYKAFVAMVRYFKPKAFVMENVPNILSIGGGIVKDAILADFKRLGYKVKVQVLLASNYGVPQNRRRAIFVGLLDGSEFTYPLPTVETPVTTMEALSDLPEGSIENGGRYPIEAQSDFQRAMRKSSKGVFNHEITIHTEQTQRIIAMVPDGGNYKDLPVELQQTRKVHIAWTRLDSRKPSITIDTGHNHHFHYLFNRVPTARESARLQSFPDTFLFLGNKMSQLKQIGNAVPPLMAYAIAKQLKQYI